MEVWELKNDKAVSRWRWGRTWRENYCAEVWTFEMFRCVHDKIFSEIEARPLSWMFDMCSLTGPWAQKSLTLGLMFCCHCLEPLNTTSSRKLQFTEFFHTKCAVERAAFPRRPFRQSRSWQWSSLKDHIQHFHLVGVAVGEMESSSRTTTYQLFDHGQVTNVLSFYFCMYKMI